MRFLTACCLLCLAACASVPTDCAGPSLSRAELLSLVKEQIRSAGGNPNVVDNGTTTPRISPDGCGYVVRLAFPTPNSGNWATYAVSRDGVVTRVFSER